jgi:hypothetical protein
MRRLFVVLATVTIGLVAVAVPASAEPNTARLNHEVSGPYTGIQTFDFSTAHCSFVHQVFDGSYKADRGRATFHIDACVTIGGAGFGYVGTFTLTTPHRAVLTGSVTGTTNAATPTASLSLTLTLDHGTREFKHVTGTIVLSGVWSNDAGVLGHGPTSGALTGKLQRAAWALPSGRRHWQSHPSVTFPSVATCPGALIIHAGGIVAGCTLQGEHASTRDSRTEERGCEVPAEAAGGTELADTEFDRAAAQQHDHEPRSDGRGRDTTEHRRSQVRK